jgi:hypothetical protein
MEKCSTYPHICLGETEEKHPCPFNIEIRGDYDDVCNCCINSEDECAADI